MKFSTPGCVKFMEKKKSFNFGQGDWRLYVGAMVFLEIMVALFDWRLAAASAVILVFVAYYGYLRDKARRKEWNEYLQDLLSKTDLVARQAAVHLPIGMAIYDADGLIWWYNDEMARLFPAENLLGEKIQDAFPGLLWARVFSHPEYEGTIKLGEQIYRAIVRRIEAEDGKFPDTPLAVIYLLNITREEELAKKIAEERAVVALVQVDNHDEVLQTLDDKNRPLLTVEINKALAEWAETHNGYLRKFAEDKYTAVFTRGTLSRLEENKFDILDRVRQIKMGNHFPATLSIGLGAGDGDLNSRGREAQLALDLALGRGGDQAVVKANDRLLFYGGKTKAVEKRTKVKARVIAHALRELVEGASQVIIMGHEHPDLDSVGAAVGMIRVAKGLGKRAYILLGEMNSTIERMVAKLQELEDYRDVFLIPEEGALRILDPQTLLVVVDTHKPSLVAGKRLLAQTERVVLIDHHRRAEEFLKDPILVYLEPYASSTCELVAEIIQYLGDKVTLKVPEANALLAGITVDTKNFVFQTGVRTFEAASFLRRAGADPSAVRQIFREDLESFLRRAEVIRNMELLPNQTAFSFYPGEVKSPQILAAQAADALLTLENIQTSVVLCAGEGMVVVSARSIGDTNVQVMMEKLGGGGHFSIAGAQLKNVTLEEAKTQVRNVILESIKEGEAK